jgi:hypothetical protein
LLTRELSALFDAVTESAWSATSLSDSSLLSELFDCTLTISHRELSANFTMSPYLRDVHDRGLMIY